MKKFTILILLLIAGFCYSADKDLTPKEKSQKIVKTFTEAIAVTYDPNVLAKKFNKKDHLWTEAKAYKFVQFKGKVEARGVKKRIRTKDGYEEVTATFVDVLKVTRFNRDYTPQIIEDLLLKKRCPVDLHLYSDDFGVTDEE